MTGNPPFAVRCLAPCRRSSGPVLVFPSDGVNPVRHNAGHEIDDDSADFIQLIPVKPMERGLESGVEIRLIFECQDGHLGEHHVGFGVAELLHGGRRVGGGEGSP